MNLNILYPLIRLRRSTGFLWKGDRDRRSVLVQRTRGRFAFSLIELLSAMAVISLLAGLSVPAVKGMTSSRGLDTGVRKVAGLLSLARSEAIARHTVVRFAVAREWAGKEDARLRKVSLWAWNSEAEVFTQISNWEELPIGVAVEPQLPEYIRKADYATKDASTVRGDCVLDERFAESAEFIHETGTDRIVARYIEFLPSGNIRIPGGSARQAVFVTTQGYVNEEGSLIYTERAEGRPASWAQINVDTLTGRVRVYQP